MKWEEIGMLLTKTVMVKWNTSNKKWYEEKGYIFSEWGKEFKVDVEDLSSACSVLVQVQCDYCNQKIHKVWYSYLKSHKTNNKDCCKDCCQIKAKELNSKKLSYKEISNYINNNELGNGCKLLTTENEFINLIKQNSKPPTNIKLKIQCRCRNIFNVSFNTFTNKKTQKKQCNVCAEEIRKSKRRLSYYSVKKIIEEKGCELLSEEYVNNYTCLKLKCTCGNIFYKTLLNFQNGQNKCNECVNHIDWDYEKIKDFIENKSNFNCILISKDYKDSKSKLRIRCKCGNDFETTFETFKNENKRHCDKCGNKIRYDKLRKSHSQFIQEIYDLIGNEYTVLSKYNNSKTKVKIKHNACGYIWNVIPNNFLKYDGTRCPYCNQSKGEIKISKYLNDKNVFNIAQKEFDGLIGLKGGNLSYDFYLPNNYNLLIEYQGIMHEQFVKGIHKSKKDFEKQQEHDKRKREYAQKHDIKLLEIWYWNYDNIEEILDKELNTIYNQECVNQ